MLKSNTMLVPWPREFFLPGMKLLILWANSRIACTAKYVLFLGLLRIFVHDIEHQWWCALHAFHQWRVDEENADPDICFVHLAKPSQRLLCSAVSRLSSGSLEIDSGCVRETSLRCNLYNTGSKCLRGEFVGSELRGAAAIRHEYEFVFIFEGQFVAHEHAIR